MDEAYCVRCHNPLEVVGLRDGLAYALLCSTCSAVWQIDAGWSRWLGKFDAELLNPHFPYA